MWYQFSQEQTYVLIRALRCLQSALYNQRMRMPTFHVQINNDLVDVESLIEWLYDRGLDARDERQAEELLQYIREKNGRG